MTKRDGGGLKAGFVNELDPGSLNARCLRLSVLDCLSYCFQSAENLGSMKMQGQSHLIWSQVESGLIVVVEAEC